MSIERVTKNILVHEPYPFTTIFNEMLQGIKHTGALGIYCYLASKPEGWSICKKEIAKHFECGKDHIDTCFKYLKEIGAIEIAPNRNEKGRIIEWSTTLKRHLSRIRKTQIVDNPDCGYPAPINKRDIEIKEKDINIGADALSPENPSDSSSSRIDPKYEYPETLYQTPENKVNETDKNNLSNIFEDNPFSIPDELIIEWRKLRKAKRAPITKRIWASMNKELSKCKNPIHAFEEMLNRGWPIVKVSWVEGSTKTAQEYDHTDTSWMKLPRGIL